MGYTDLRKIYYMDKSPNKESYSNEYSKRFFSDDAVKVDFYIREDQAFFILCDEIVTAILLLLAVTVNYYI